MLAQVVPRSAGVSRSWHRSAVREAFECEETAPGGRPGLADSGSWNSQDAPHLYKRGSSCVSLCRVPISLIKTKLELETSCKWLLVHLQANLLVFSTVTLTLTPGSSAIRRHSAYLSLLLQVWLHRCPGSLTRETARPVTICAGARSDLGLVFCHLIN